LHSNAREIYQDELNSSGFTARINHPSSEISIQLLPCADVLALFSAVLFRFLTNQKISEFVHAIMQVGERELLRTFNSFNERLYKIVDNF
jgi:hypothetical protein